MKIKTSELKGAALDWAVAHATKAWEFAHKWYPTMTLDPTFTGVRDYAIDGMIYLVPRNAFRQDPQPFNPSRWWEHGGRLIDEHCVLFDTDDKSVIWAKLPEQSLFKGGDNHLVAACRAIVMAKLGEEVEIPDELCDESK